MTNAEARLRTRRGFTLVEVVVAITIGAILMVATHQLVVAAADGARRVAVQRRDASRSVNGEEMLRQLLLLAEPRNLDRADTTPSGNPLVSGIEGDARGITIPSWCSRARGWSEPCNIRLEVRVSLGREESVASAVVAFSTIDTIELVAGPGEWRLLYLASGRDGGRWQAGWSRDLPLPAAVGIDRGTDTLLFRVARGSS